jgi:hypothetical protein
MSIKVFADIEKELEILSNKYPCEGGFYCEENGIGDDGMKILKAFIRSAIQQAFDATSSVALQGKYYPAIVVKTLDAVKAAQSKFMAEGEK